MRNVEEGAKKVVREFSMFSQKVIKAAPDTSIGFFLSVTRFQTTGKERS
jgi:hypothetical protein